MLFMYNETLSRVHVTIVVVKDLLLHILSVRLCSLFTQHAKHMRRVILSYLACLSLPHSSTLSHELHEFRVLSYRT